MLLIEAGDINSLHELDQRLGSKTDLVVTGTLEDYVGEQNPVRVIEAFVESLDLAQKGFRFPKDDPLGRGRAYPPAALLKLYLYGYVHGIRSAAAGSGVTGNLEVLWLVQKLAPDFKTIADFVGQSDGV